MRASSIIAIALAALLAASLANAQAGGASPQPQIGITVDRDTLVQGEPFQLTINIASQSREEPQVKLPPLGGLRVLRQSESHPMSFSFSFGFGQQTQKISKRQSTYDFLVVADRPGKYIIDPVVVEVDGQKYKSQPYSLQIVASSGGGSQQAPPLKGDGADPGTPDSADQEVSLDGAKVDPDFFLQMSLSKDEVFAGEGVVLTVYLYTTWNLSGYHLVREPGTEGFWAETLDTGNQRRNSAVVQIGQKSYERTELRKLALFPIKTGEITIAPAIAELEVRRGGFFSKRKKTKRVAEPISITVNPIPAEGRPAGFDEPNVGKFSFRSSVDRTEVKVGEPVTLKMTVRGSGNLRNISLPELEEVKGFKVYAPESEIDLHARGSSVTGTRTSKTLMIPKEAGTFQIPEFTWSHFDPDTAEFVTRRSGPVRIKVTPGAEIAGGKVQAAGDETADDGDMDRLNRKLRSITSRADLEVGSARLVFERPWFGLLAILAPLAYIGLAIATRARRRRAMNEMKDRSRKADGRASKALNDLARRSADISSEEFFANLERVLVGFLEDRLEVPVAGDTMSELGRRMIDRGYEEEHASRCVAEMEACEFARFARGTSDEKERQAALDRLRSLIEDLAGVPVTPPEEEER